MRYLFLITLLFIPSVLQAQVREASSGQIELEGGQVVIESLTVRMSGDSVYLELGDLKIFGSDGPAVHRFSIPAITAASSQNHSIRKKIEPSVYAGNMRVELERLEESDGELLMDINVKITGDAVNRRLSLLVIPELVGQDNSLTVAGLLVNGWGKERLYNRRISYRDQYLMDNRPDIKVAVEAVGDSLLRYNIRVPYEFWMDDAVLDIHQVLGSPAGKEQLYTIANAGRVTLQKIEPYEVEPHVNLIVPAPEEKSRNMQGQAFLDFPVGRSVIVPTFRRNPEELSKIQSAISKVQNDPDVRIIGLFIEGYASPDGSYATNERLARERSQALASYIAQNYGVPAGIIRTSSVAEDWEGLKVLVEESGIARREEMLAVIDSGDEPDRKEQRLKGFGASWLVLRDSMFPQLRRVEYQVDFTVKDYTLEESRELAGRNPEMLSQRELFLLAESYEEDSPERERLYETIIRLYPDDQTAIINYSSILLARGELAAARRYLDRVADHPQALNNLGVYHLLAGEPDEAEGYLNRASAAGIPEAVHNLEELRRKRENDTLMERYKR